MSSTKDWFECPNCGGYASREQDNRTCEVYYSCPDCDWCGETSNTDDDKAVIIDSWRIIMTTTDGRKIELTEDIPAETCRDIDTVIQLFYETSYPDIFS